MGGGQLFRKSADVSGIVVLGTVSEAAFQNAFSDHWQAGLFVDAITDDPLFTSVHKFNSGNGWLCFFDTIAGENISETTERAGRVIRIWLHSRTSGADLGYLFLDGPEPTGLSYCSKSSALRFLPPRCLRLEGYGGFDRLFASEA